MKVKELKILLESLEEEKEIRICVSDCGGGIGQFTIHPNVDKIDDYYILDIDIGHNH